ncbi:MULTISPECIES: hypothetical protein [Sporosarcina]|uniref:Uncharacterized protein n=1 Tax=Sporosarcina psychrophila TaxID=1476 RepID=A0ABV2K591_SPOPS
MTINHGGNLTEEYFRAYVSLVMNSRNYTLEKEKHFMVESFLTGNPTTYGPITGASYINAVKVLSLD